MFNANQYLPQFFILEKLQESTAWRADRGGGHLGIWAIDNVLIVVLP